MSSIFPQRTISLSTVSSGGSIIGGKVGIEFVFSSDFAGTIAGVAFSGTTDVSWSPPPLRAGDCYGPLVYTISAGSARLTVLS